MNETTKAEILRLYEVDQLRIGTIARMLGLHHATVRRALHRADSPSVPKPRPSRIERFVDWIRSQLFAYPELPCTVLHRQLRSRGYEGGVAQIRRAVARHGLRPAKPPRVFARLSFLPGEQAQVDWMYVGELVLTGGVKRPVHALVITLSYSGDTWAGFYHEMTMTSVMHGHVAAFEFFGGAPRVMLYDNMKTAVISRTGLAIEWNVHLLALARHYRFEPRACQVRRANEKGRVERRIRDLRTSFLPGLHYGSLDQLAEQFQVWRTEVLLPRTRREAEPTTVEQRSVEEQQHLTRPPTDQPPFSLARIVERRRVDTQGYVHHDSNRYSVPAAWTGRHVDLYVTHDAIKVVADIQGDTACVHARSWSRHDVITLDRHATERHLLAKRAKTDSTKTEITTRYPSLTRLLTAAQQKGYTIGHEVRQLDRLLREHDAALVLRFAEEAIQRQTPSAQSIRWLLDQHIERQRDAQGHPPVPLILPSSLKHDISNHFLPPTSLASYDELTKSQKSTDLINAGPGPTDREAHPSGPQGGHREHLPGATDDESE